MVSKDICTQMWSRAAYLKLKVYTAQRLDHLIITQSWTLGILSESLNRCEFISPAVVQQNVARRHNLWRVMHLSNTSKYSHTPPGADALIQLLCCSSNIYLLLVCKGQSKRKVLCICMCNFILIVSYLHIDYSSIFIFMEKTAKALLQFYISELRGSSYVCH